MKKETMIFSNLSLENATFEVSKSGFEFDNCNLSNVKFICKSSWIKRIWNYFKYKIL